MTLRRAMMDFRMRMVFRAIAMLLCSYGAVQAQDAAWIQLEAHPDLATSEAAARLYAQSNIAGFRLGEKWYVLALGPYDPAEAAGQMNALKSARAIPRDAYITDGKDHGQQFWPIGAAQSVPAQTPAPTQPVIATQAASDETPDEARASEAILSREDRALVQTAMAWYGFYDAKVDGSFGKGTRQSMAAWQTAFGYEATGVLTSVQRATLVGNYQADQAEFGFETITEPEAGIEIALPSAMVSFDRYEPPFVHYAEKNGSKLRLILISEPGDQAALAGLYDVLQSLDAVPATGDRTLEDGRFTINGTNEKMSAFAYAATSKGAVKGFLALWDPSISAKMLRVLPALQASFRATGDKYLDPSLVPLDDAARTGLLAGMQVKRPTRTGSGIFVGNDGSVLTNAETVAECGTISLDNHTLVSVIAADQGVALLRPMTPLQPTAIAPLTTVTPREGQAVVVAGYSPFVALPAAVLSRGTVAGTTGLDGAPNYITLAVAKGDIGGPVLDQTGALLGMMAAAPANKVLPDGVSLALSSGVLAQILADNGISGPTVQTIALTADALNTAARGMTTQIACWP